MQIERVKKLHKDLQKQEKNHKHIIEELSEYILYGDHQNEDVFEYFAEHNILNLFYERIKKSDLSLSIFIIERMSMIITNLQNPLNLNYVLSNPVLHDFINHNYDFSHPELVDYYVNFLKTIAIRINRENFYLYFNQRYCTFPLLWQAQKFIDYPDNLVRNTIQNIILSLSKCILFFYSLVAADPLENNCTKSTIMSQNKIVVQFKTYLTKSPFLGAYLKYILQIQNLIVTLKNREQLEQLHDLLMFFTDLFTECPFLSQILEQMITNHIIQPILDCLLLNKCKQIKISCELGLFIIYTLLTKLPIVYSIMQYFCEDNIFIDESFQLYDTKASNKWVFDNSSREKDFLGIFQDDQIELSERISSFIKLKQNNLRPNPYKIEFVQLLRTRDSALLYLQLTIWQVAKTHNYPIPLNNIIKLLQTQNEIVFSIDVMNAIILLIQNENLKELEQIYQNLNIIVTKIIQSKKLEEGLLVNWPIIQEFNWEKFKEKTLCVRLENINPYQDDIRLLQFKFVYLWMLIKHSQFDFQREKHELFDVNQQINLSERDDEFVKISNTADVTVDSIQYLILDEKNGYLIHTSSSENPEIGIIKYVQPLVAIECSFLGNTLIFECHKLYQNHFKSYRLQFNTDSIKPVINRIYQAKSHVNEQIFIKLQALLE